MMHFHLCYMGGMEGVTLFPANHTDQSWASGSCMRKRADYALSLIYAYASSLQRRFYVDMWINSMNVVGHENCLIYQNTVYLVLLIV